MAPFSACVVFKDPPLAKVTSRVVSPLVSRVTVSEVPLVHLVSVTDLEEPFGLVVSVVERVVPLEKLVSETLLAGALDEAPAGFEPDSFAPDAEPEELGEGAGAGAELLDAILGPEALPGEVLPAAAPEVLLEAPTEEAPPDEAGLDPEGTLDLIAALPGEGPPTLNKGVAISIKGIHIPPHHKNSTQVAEAALYPALY